MSAPSTSASLVPRSVARRLDELIGDLRVVVVNGPRQVGKTTLLRTRQSGAATYRTLDDEGTLAAAIEDPIGFATPEQAMVIIDEVQRGGDPLIRAIKARVDSDNRPGQYLLAGSTRFLTSPSISESLAGRAAVVPVWPFSQGEPQGVRETFIDRALESERAVRSLRPPSLSRADYVTRITRGGFPEPLRLTSRRARSAWFANYVTAVTERDIREMASVREPSAAGLVLRAMAAQSGGLTVTSKLASLTALSRATVDRYIGLLETVMLCHRLPPWSRNPLRRVVKHPKLYVVDSGLQANLLGWTSDPPVGAATDPRLGQLTETFVVNELVKQASWADNDVRLHHYRDRGGAEVDVILESADGGVVGVEVKASQTVTGADFRHLHRLAEVLGPAFRHGVVVYLGAEVHRFGPGLTALPLGCLWSA